MVIKDAANETEDLSSIMAAHPDRWYFSKEQIRNTPSVRDGIDHAKEIGYRQQCANFIQDIGQRVAVNQLSINTAIVYMHRFYMFHSFKQFHRNVMAPCFLFLSAKVEEQPRKLEHCLKVAHHCLNKDTDAHLDTKSNEYMQMAQELVDNESILLQTLGFEVSVEHPHTYVVRCTQLVKAHKELAQTAYFLATNRDPISERVKILIQENSVVLPNIPSSQDKKIWWEYIDNTVTSELIEELSSYFIRVLDNCPTRLKKKIAGGGPVIYKGGVLQSKNEANEQGESSTSQQNGTSNASEPKKAKPTTDVSTSFKPSTSSGSLQNIDKTDGESEKSDSQKSSRNTLQANSKTSLSDHLKHKERKEHSLSASQKPHYKHSEHDKKHREHSKHSHTGHREQSLSRPQNSSLNQSSPLKVGTEVDSKPASSFPTSKLADASQNLSSVIEKASMSLPPLPLPLSHPQKHSLSDSKTTSSPAKKQRVDPHGVKLDSDIARHSSESSKHKHRHKYESSEKHKHSSKHKASSSYSSHGASMDASKKEHRKHHDAKKMEKHMKHSSSHHKEKHRSPYKHLEPGSSAVSSPAKLATGPASLASSASSGEEQERLPPPPPPPVISGLLNTSSATVSGMPFQHHQSLMKSGSRTSLPAQTSAQMQFHQSSSQMQRASSGPKQGQNTFNTYGLPVAPFQPQKPTPQSRISNPAERPQSYGLHHMSTQNFFPSHSSNVGSLNKPPPPPPGAPSLIGFPTSSHSRDLPPPPPPPPPGT